MSTVTRWVEYAIGSLGVMGTGGTTVSGLGTRAFSLATASVGDGFNIGSSNNRLYVNIGGDTAPYITLASGTNLDPRFVAKDITEKLHNLTKGSVEWDQAQCVWENNQLKIYSGDLGSGTSAAVISGTNTAHEELGWGSKSESGGSASSNTFNGGITVSGTYNGFFDEIYKVVINKETNIGTPSKGGSNTYTGTITKGGVFNHVSDITYTLSIDMTNGSTMGGGTGFVPTLSWTSTGSADDGGPIELLYPNFWYQLGTKGAMVKFSDAVFNTVDPAWTIVCTYPQYVVNTETHAPVGTAKYVWSSSRGDDAAVAVDTSTGYNAIGTRGVYMKFHGSNNLSAGDEFYIICTPPQPQSYDITSLNYGNVTVSTESPVKAVLFEIMSGAIEISTVKFGLQNHGNFAHHDAGSDDTKFRWGTVGPGNNAAGTGKEWRANVTASDISSDSPPAYLYATKENLSVVADADASETVGSSAFAGMCADPIWLNVKLGANEVGSNSLINLRLFFDYS